MPEGAASTGQNHEGSEAASRKCDTDRSRSRSRSRERTEEAKNAAAADKKCSVRPADPVARNRCHQSTETAESHEHRPHPDHSPRARTFYSVPNGSGHSEGHCSCAHSADKRSSRERERDYRSERSARDYRPEQSAVSDVSVLIVDPLPPIHHSAPPHPQHQHQQQKKMSPVFREFDERSESAARVTAGPVMSDAASMQQRGRPHSGQEVRSDEHQYAAPQRQHSNQQNISAAAERQTAKRPASPEVQPPHTSGSSVPRSEGLRCVPAFARTVSNCSK